MAEWLYEDGIGERRAVLVDGDRIVEARVERDSDGARVGAIAQARLVSRRDRLARLDSGEEVWLSDMPPCTDGASCFVAIAREAIPERDQVKRAVGSLVLSSEGRTDAGHSLIDSIAGGMAPVRRLHPHEADALEAAGWSELLDEAATGLIPFDGGLLRMALTPAMTVFDVDGVTDPETLAKSAAGAVAQAIVRHGIAGSIVVDFPTLPDKRARVAVAERFDAVMSGAFERTAINGFGLLQIIRPRLRPSIPERVQFARIESAALAALRRAERATGTGAITVTVNRQVAAWIEARPPLLAELAQRTARQPRVCGEPGRTIEAIDVH